MTTAVLTPSSTGFDRPHSGSSFLGSLADIWAMTRRNLVHISREPMQLSDVTIQPLLFTAMFAYIFGGAVSGNCLSGSPHLIFTWLGLN